MAILIRVERLTVALETIRAIYPECTNSKDLHSRYQKSGFKSTLRTAQRDLVEMSLNGLIEHFPKPKKYEFDTERHWMPTKRLRDLLGLSDVSSTVEVKI